MHVLGRRGSSTLPSVSLDACNQYAVDRHLHSMIVRMVFDIYAVNDGSLEKMKGYFFRGNM